jgi:battenin
MCSSLAKIINSSLLIKISYTKRIIFLSFYFWIAYFSLYLILNSTDDDEMSKKEAFYLSLIPSFVMGTGSALGEGTMLGYLRNFPKNYVAGWGSGTGLAGVAGALLSLLFKIYDIKTRTLYLVISPICFVYLLSFLLIHKLYKKHIGNQETKIFEEDLLRASSDSDNTGNVSQNKNLNFKNVGKVLKKGSRFIVNMALVYFLEYVVLSGMCDRVAKKKYISEFQEYQYEVFSLSYQVGVFISRSSLFIVKNIKAVEMFTILQLINLLIWVIEFYTGFITIAWVAILHLVFIGLMGGSAYVGCFYFLLNSKDIPANMKELSVNIGSIFNDIGIFSASIAILVLDNTIMKI